MKLSSMVATLRHHIHRQASLSIVGLALVAGTSAAGAAVLPTARPLLDRLERAIAPVNDLEAQFAQVRHLALTDETVSAAGRLRFINPDKFRLDYSTPDPDILAIRADTLLVYFASLKQAQRYRLSDDATTRNMFMLFSSERGRLEKAFDISLAPASPEGEALRLQPLPTQGHASVTEIRVFLDPRSGLPRRLFFREEGGDTVVFELKSVKVNRRLKAADFVVKLPAGTEVISREGTTR